ncbi:unnamed protein product [Parnassius mnemosyne]|uniref:Tc1-like transposase DDE domain-containing protein n=1 Tax=Parnassius mnemosyne TaxID=213953 RepID=A0AAV1KVC5_9NEOP
MERNLKKDQSVQSRNKTSIPRRRPRAVVLGTRPHRPRTVSAVPPPLAPQPSCGCVSRPWSPYPDDLNPIEHIWDNLKRRVRSRIPAPTTIDELKQSVIEEWQNIPQQQIKDVIDSMPNRLMEVMRARGGNTHY